MRNLFLMLIFSTLLLGVTLPQNSPYAGGVMIKAIHATTTPKAYFGKKELMVLKGDEKDQYYIVAGLSLYLKAHESYKVSLNKDQKKSNFDVTLQEKQYKKQYIKMKNKRKVTPQKQDYKRIKSESARSKAALALFTPQKFKNLEMIKPVDVEIKDDFGKRRYFNNKPRKPHSGFDMPAPTGTRIVAPLAGEVVEMGAFFFNGNVLFLDHGQGLVSMYCHMNAFDVMIGEHVKQGQKIGEVGATGRVTGPHLHWGVSLNGAMVDPRLFFKQ